MKTHCENGAVASKEGWNIAIVILKILCRLNTNEERNLKKQNKTTDKIIKHKGVFTPMLHKYLLWNKNSINNYEVESLL